MGRVAAEPPERRRSLLVLGAGAAQLGLLETASAHGVWTAVCDRDPAAPGFAFADRRCIVSTDDESAIERLAAALPLDGVIAAGTDTPVAIAARIADKLGLAHPISPATALLATSKLRQREALAESGVPQPSWEAVGGDGETELEPPLVVKPADRSGRMGLTFVEHRSELERALRRARDATRSGVVIVEEYVDGPEVTVAGFVAAGDFIPLAVMDRISGDAGQGVPLGYVWPSRHAEASVEVTRRAVGALGIDDGPTTTRLRISRGGPEVIDVAARLGAGHESELVELVTGVELTGLALAAALGQPIAASEIAVRSPEGIGGAATYFLVAPPGRLESTEVPQGQGGVVSVRLYREPGFDFVPPRRIADCAGAVLAAGAAPHEAIARAAAAAERIRFVTADAEAMV
jgi:biotin carboxylase